MAPKIIALRHLRLNRIFVKMKVFFHLKMDSFAILYAGFSHSKNSILLPDWGYMVWIKSYLHVNTNFEISCLSRKNLGSLNCEVLCTPYITCVQCIGEISSVHREIDTISALGVVQCTGGYYHCIGVHHQCIGNIICAFRRSHDLCGGYHQCIGGVPQQYSYPANALSTHLVH